MNSVGFYLSSLLANPGAVIAVVVVIGFGFLMFKSDTPRDANGKEVKRSKKETSSATSSDETPQQ